MARNALSYGDTDSDNPLARAAAYAAPWTTDGADTSVGVPSIGAGGDAVGQWMAAQLAKMQGTRPTAPIWNPDNPVGTETLQSMGMPQPTNYAGPVGQYVNPVTGQLTTQGQARMADNPLLGFDTGGIGGVLKGFHGSPHAFDRFSNDAIGSGEGAQAYGYGHYLADSEGVARSYRDALTRDSGAVTYQTPYRDSRLDNSSKTHERFLADRFRSNGGDVDATTAHLERDLEANPGDATITKALELARFPDSALTLKDANPGHMYEVNVNAEPEHFLDWDKPLSEQHPVVRQALNDIGVAPPGASFTVRPVEGGHVVDFVDGNNKFTTSRVYQSAEDAQRQASITMKMMNRDPTGAEMVRQNQGIEAKLAEAGIPGIRYLDAGSRRAGEGSRNTVVFDPSTMDIIRRYGLAGLMAGGGAAALGGQGQQQ